MTSEGKSDTEKWVQEKGAKYAYGYDKGGSFQNKCGVSGIPHALLVDPTGKLVWRGHPASLTEDIIKTAIAGALKRPLFELPKEYAKVKIAVAKGDLAGAVREAKAIAAAANAPKDASAVVDAVQGMVTSAMTNAEAMLSRGDLLGAQREFSRLAKAAAGLPEGKEAQQGIEKIKKNPDSAKGIKAQLELEKALQLPARRPSESAERHDAIEAIVKRYAGTFAAAEAEKILAAEVKAKK